MAPKALCHLLPSPLASTSSSSATLLSLLPFILFIISVTVPCSSAGKLPQGIPQEETDFNVEIGSQLLQPSVRDPSEHDSEQIYLTEQADGNNNDCNALVFAKNMSTLLAEASQMLGRVKNSRERNWLKAFIERLTSLADDLLKHPDARRSQCLRNQKTKGGEDIGLRQSLKKDFMAKSKNSIVSDHVLFSQKHLPARSHISSHVQVENRSPTSSKLQSQNLITKSETNQKDFVTQKMSEIDGVSKLDKNDDLVQQLHIGPPGITDSTIPQQEHPHGMIDVKVWKPLKVSPYEHTSIASSKRGVTNPPTFTPKEESLQKLLGEMASQVQKLKDLGGTEEDLINLWKESDPKTPLPVFEVTPSSQAEQVVPDFVYEEQGAAAGELQADDNQHDLLAAPSLRNIESTMSSIPTVSSSNDLEITDESYSTSKPALEDEENEGDDLVRQLQEEKFLKEVATKSLSPSQHNQMETLKPNTPPGGTPYKRLQMSSIFG